MKPQWEWYDWLAVAFDAVIFPLGYAFLCGIERGLADRKSLHSFRTHKWGESSAPIIDGSCREISPGGEGVERPFARLDKEPG